MSLPTETKTTKARLMKGSFVEFYKLDISVYLLLRLETIALMNKHNIFNENLF